MNTGRPSLIGPVKPSPTTRCVDFDALQAGSKSYLLNNSLIAKINSILASCLPRQLLGPAWKTGNSYAVFLEA